MSEVLDKPRSVTARAKIAPTSHPAPAWVTKAKELCATLATAIALLKQLAESERNCATPAERAVADLGEMLCLRLLPPVRDYLLAAPVDEQRAGVADEMLNDPRAILEALEVLTFKSKYQEPIRAAFDLVHGVQIALMEAEPWPVLLEHEGC